MANIMKSLFSTTSIRKNLEAFYTKQNRNPSSIKRKTEASTITDKENKGKAFFINNQLYFYSFLLPVFIMLLLFIIKGIFPFGTSSFLNIDMYHQYFPFLSEFYHKLTGGESLLYSFHVGIGTNFVDLYGYYLASPTNWLIFLCPEQYIIEFMSYMTIIKIGLCSLTFTIYARHHFNVKKAAFLLFGFAYSFSGYLAAYNWNVMWLDCIILAPIVLLGIERLVNKGKCKMYCIALTFSILTNYYLSIMLCIFLVFYFFILLISAKDKWQAFLRFSIYSLLAGGMACVLLMPALEMLTQSEYASATFPSKITTYFPLFDILSRQFANVAIETGLDHWPNIYCGVAVLFLLPLYIISKHIPLKEKIGKLALLLFLLLSFSSNILTFIWHGFNYPNSLPSRQSFLYILLLLIVCLEAFLHLSEYSKKHFCKVGSGIFIFLVLSQKLVTNDALTPYSYILTFISLVCFATIIFLYYTRKYNHKTLFILALLLLVTEMTINMGVTSLSTVSRENYLKYNEDISTLVTNLKDEDSDFYRINKENEITKNDAAILGYPAITLFSSTSNSNINNFYEKYGLQQSKVYYGNEGVTPFTSALLTNKYTLSTIEKNPSPLYRHIQELNGVYLYEHSYSLPLGYMIPSDLPVEELASNPLEQQNNLGFSLGSTTPLFQEIEVDSSGNIATFITNSEGHYYAYTDTKKINEITASINGEMQTFKKLKNTYILDLGYLSENTAVELVASDSASMMLYAYSLNESSLAQLTEQLNDTPFVIDSFNEYQVSGHINVKEDGDLLLAIPYEPNWNILVDGVETTYDSFENSLIKIPLTPGAHSISLVFSNPSLSFGLMISLLSLLIFFTISVLVFVHEKLGEAKRTQT